MSVAPNVTLDFSDPIVYTRLKELVNHFVPQWEHPNATELERTVIAAGKCPSDYTVFIVRGILTIISEHNEIAQLRMITNQKLNARIDELIKENYRLRQDLTK